MAKILLNVSVDSKKADEGLRQLKESLQKIVAELGEMKPNKDLTAQLNALTRAYKAVEDQAKKTSKETADHAKAQEKEATSAAKVVKAYADAKISLEKKKQAEEKSNQEAAKTLIQEEKLEQQAIKTAAAQDKYAESSKKAGEQTSFLGGTLGDTIAKFAKAEVAFLAVRTPLNLIKNALAEVDDVLIKTEDAVIEVQRVLDETVPAGEISNRLYSIAYEYGSTFENASQIAVNFARAGRTWNESLEATEAALLAMNVAELNATEASDGLLSILAQFGMETSELTNVVDKLNKTADKNPVSTQKLLQAIQRSGSAAKNANVSFDQTLGLITAISEATNRSGQNIGTAINSLIQYSQKNVDVFSTLSDESAAIVEKFKMGLASIVDVWQQVAIDIHNDKQSRDNIISALGTDGLEELSSTLHDELGDLVSEINGVYDVANTYRKNYFIALLDNMDRFMDVQEQLTDYQGYSQEENAKYMETYTAKVNQLKDAWQRLANDEQGILGLKKTLVETGIKLVDFVDVSGGIVNSLGMIGGAAAGIATILNADKLAKGWQNLATTIQLLPKLLNGTASAATTAQAAFGWIGLAVTAFSILAGAIESTKKHLADEREETIKNWKETSTQSQKLEELYKKYTELNVPSEEQRKIESEINELLGDKAIVLDDVITGTEEYKDAVHDLVEELKVRNRVEAIAAQTAALDEFVAKAQEAVNSIGSAEAAQKGLLSSLLYGIGEKTVSKLLPKAVIKDFEDAVDILEIIEKKLKQAEDKLVKAYESGNQKKITSARKYYNSVNTVYKELSAALETYKNIYSETTEVIHENNRKIVDKTSVFAHKSQAELEAMAESLGITVEELTAVAEKAEETAESENELAKSVASGTQAFNDINGQLKATETQAEATASAVKDLGAEIDEVQSSLSLLDEVQKEYDETGSISIDTLQKIIGLGGEYLDLIIDENGQLKLNREKVDELTGAKKELLEKMAAEQVAEYAVTTLHEYMQGSTENVGTAALEAANQVHALALSLYELEGDEQGAANVEERWRTALHNIAHSAGVLNASWRGEWEQGVIDYDAKLRSLLRMTDTSTTSWNPPEKTSSSSSSAKETDTYLESLKDAVSLRESELTLMEHQGATQDQQIAKIKQIQEAIAVQADYMRSITVSEEEAAAHQAEINKLSSEWWKWQEKINKFGEENAKNAEKQAEEQAKAAEEAKKAYIASLNEETSRHKQVVSDLKAELNLWQKQGKSTAEQVDEMKKIQSALHDQAEWLRYLQKTQTEIKVTQAEIDALSAEWWDWQEKILKLYKETLDAARDIELDAIQKTIDGILKEVDIKKEELALDEKRLAVTEAEQNLVEAIAEARLKYVKTVLSDYIQGLSDAKTLEEKQNAVIEAREKLMAAEREARAKAIIDSFNAEKDGKNSILSLEERRLAVEKAREALREAQENRTTRVYNEASGQWEYQADAKNVQTTQDNLKKAVDALNEFIVEAAWDEVAEAVENGSVTEADVLAILEKWAKEAYGEGSPEYVQKITAAYRKAMGTPANPDSIAGQVSAVDSAVENLNDYLKNEAVKELEKYIADGNTSQSGMKAILDRWLSMGEGGELYEWRDGLLGTVTDAIASGYYDDRDVLSATESVERAIESLHDYIENRFISEVSDLVRNGTAEELRDFIDQQSRIYDEDDVPLDWANRLYESKSRYEETSGQYDRLYNGQYTEDEFQMWLARMKANSAAWWTTTGEERKELEATNMAIGQMLGLIKGSDGAWYYPDGTRVYDKGGLLYGIGGIKATNRPEAILDPELTAKLLQPQSEAAFKAFTDAMHILFGGDGRTPFGGFTRNGGISDSHNVSNVINGIPISPSMAETHTIAELCRLLPLVGRA